MNWIKTGISSLFGGFAIGIAVDLVLLTIGDCGIGAVAAGIVCGVPVGNVFGIGVYRKFGSDSISSKADILGGILALILSGISAFAGLYAMDVIGSVPGLLVALSGSCLASLLGYAAGLRIGKPRQERAKPGNL